MSEQTILDKIQRGAHKVDVAAEYAVLIRDREGVNWKLINAAIIARWSKTVLLEIKRLAWTLQS